MTPNRQNIDSLVDAGLIQVKLMGRWRTIRRRLPSERHRSNPYVFRLPWKLPRFYGQIDGGDFVGNTLRSDLYRLDLKALGKMTRP